MTAISVVIPTCNRPEPLERVLTALDGQVEPDGGFEVIVVDDGSAQDLSGVVDRHPAAVLLRQANGGAASARNRGWRVATSDVVAFLDDDTVPTSTWVVEMVAAFAHQPPPDAVGGAIVALVPGRLAGFMQAEALVDHHVTADGEVRYLVTANAAYRRTALARLGGFSEEFAGASGEDTDLTLRAAAAGLRLVVVPDAAVAHDNRASLRELLSTYRRHGRSRRLVVAANPGTGWGDRRWQVLHPSAWRDRYRRYRRTGASRATSVGYLALRFAGLCAYSVGLVEDRIASRRLDSRRA